MKTNLKGYVFSKPQHHVSATQYNHELGSFLQDGATLKEDLLRTRVSDVISLSITNTCHGMALSRIFFKYEGNSDPGHRCPDIWSNIIPGVSVRLFLDEIRI